ncbi:hypothetical protein BJV74DRAFT_854767 [Russula compacta]|nr:hypothetical protein BJV74DRAFT_854767 [Russula compacta]
MVLLPQSVRVAWEVYRTYVVHNKAVLAAIPPHPIPSPCSRGTITIKLSQAAECFEYRYLGRATAGTDHPSYALARAAHRTRRHARSLGRPRPRRTDEGRQGEGARSSRERRMEEGRKNHWVHGLIYELETGTLRDLSVPRGLPRPDGVASSLWQGKYSQGIEPRRLLYCIVSL